jgi:hypothetical protein
MAMRKDDPLKAAYQTDWDQLQPYLKAFVGGKHADENATAEDYERYRRDRNTLWGWSAAVTVVLCVFGSLTGVLAIAAYAYIAVIGPMIGLATQHALAEIFGGSGDTRSMEKVAQFAGAALLLAIVPWVIAMGAAGRGRMKRVRARKYYLQNFKALHARRGADFNWSAALFWLWPTYRGMHAWAGALLVLALALLCGDSFMHAGEMPAWYRGARIAVIIGFVIVIGMTATKIYFRHAMHAVAAALALPKVEALKTLQTRGGTYPWLMPVFVIALVYAAPFVTALSDSAKENAKMRSYVAQFGTPKNQATANSTNASFSAMIKALEKSGQAPGLKGRHPELYVDTPQYDYRLVTEVIWRTNRNLRAGMDELEALRQAIREIETAKEAAKSR